MTPKAVAAEWRQSGYDARFGREPDPVGGRVRPGPGRRREAGLELAAGTPRPARERAADRPGAVGQDRAQGHAAAKALGRLGPVAKDAVPALAAALKDPDAGVRVRVAGTLAEIGPAAQAAAVALRDAAKDRDPGVRAAAAAALKKIEGR